MKNKIKEFGDKFSVKNVEKILVFWMVITSIFLILGSIPVQADLAPNDFKPNDLGKEVREEDKQPKNGKPDYEDKNPNKNERDYQTHGSDGLNHDGVGGHDKDNDGVRDPGEDPFDRGDIASMAGRYQGPKNGYEEINAPAPCTGKIKVPKAGGANYASDFPRTAPQGPIDHKKVTENVKKFVHDFLQPACWNRNAGQGAVSDKEIIDDFNKENIDIGKRSHPQGDTNYVCHNQASFFCSLMRELGYPCREKWVSLTRNNRHVYPEAATNVWYNGEWHLEDPFLQVNDNANNYKDTRITDVRIWKSRTGPYDRGPGSDPDNPTTPPDETVMRSGTFTEESNPCVVIYIQDFDGKITGETTCISDITFIDSFIGEMRGVEEQIPFSWYSPHGLPIMSDWTEKASFLGNTTENIFLGFSGIDPSPEDVGTRKYTIVVINCCNETEEFNVSLSAIETNREIILSTNEIRGTVHSNESINFPFVVTVGDLILEPLPAITPFSFLLALLSLLGLGAIAMRKVYKR